MYVLEFVTLMYIVIFKLAVLLGLCASPIYRGNAYILLFTETLTSALECVNVSMLWKSHGLYKFKLIKSILYIVADVCTV